MFFGNLMDEREEYLDNHGCSKNREVFDPKADEEE